MRRLRVKKKQKKKDFEELPKQLSSGRCVICVDKIDCCMSCIRRSRKPKRSSKNEKQRSKNRRAKRKDDVD